MIVLSYLNFSKNSIFLCLEGGRNMLQFNIDDNFHLHIIEIADDEIVIVFEKQTVGDLYLFI